MWAVRETAGPCLSAPGCARVGRQRRTGAGMQPPPAT